MSRPRKGTGSSKSTTEQTKSTIVPGNLTSGVQDASVSFSPMVPVSLIEDGKQTSEEAGQEICIPMTPIRTPSLTMERVEGGDIGTSTIASAQNKLQPSPPDDEKPSGTGVLGHISKSPAMDITMHQRPINIIDNHLNHAIGTAITASPTSLADVADTAKDIYSMSMPLASPPQPIVPFTAPTQLSKDVLHPTTMRGQLGERSGQKRRDGSMIKASTPVKAAMITDQTRTLNVSSPQDSSTFSPPQSPLRSLQVKSSTTSPVAPSPIPSAERGMGTATFIASGYLNNQSKMGPSQSFGPGNSSFVGLGSVKSGSSVGMINGDGGGSGSGPVASGNMVYLLNNSNNGAVRSGINPMLFTQPYILRSTSLQSPPTASTPRTGLVNESAQSIMSSPSNKIPHSLGNSKSQPHIVTLSPQQSLLPPMPATDTSDASSFFPTSASTLYSTNEADGVPLIIQSRTQAHVGLYSRLFFFLVVIVTISLFLLSATPRLISEHLDLDDVLAHTVPLTLALIAQVYLVHQSVTSDSVQDLVSFIVVSILLTVLVIFDYTVGAETDNGGPCNSNASSFTLADSFCTGSLIVAVIAQFLYFVSLPLVLSQMNWQWRFYLIVGADESLRAHYSSIRSIFAIVRVHIFLVVVLSPICLFSLPIEITLSSVVIAAFVFEVFWCFICHASVEHHQPILYLLAIPSGLVFPAFQLFFFIKLASHNTDMSHTAKHHWVEAVVIHALLIITKAIIFRALHLAKQANNQDVAHKLRDRLELQIASAALAGRPLLPRPFITYLPDWLQGCLDKCARPFTVYSKDTTLPSMPSEGEKDGNGQGYVPPAYVDVMDPALAVEVRYGQEGGHIQGRRSGRNQERRGESTLEGRSLESGGELDTESAADSLDTSIDGGLDESVRIGTYTSTIMRGISDDDDDARSNYVTTQFADGQTYLSGAVFVPNIQPKVFGSGYINGQSAKEGSTLTTAHPNQVLQQPRPNSIQCTGGQTINVDQQTTSTEVSGKIRGTERKNDGLPSLSALAAVGRGVSQVDRESSDVDEAVIDSTIKQEFVPKELDLPSTTGGVIKTRVSIPKRKSLSPSKPTSETT